MLVPSNVSVETHSKCFSSSEYDMEGFHCMATSLHGIFTLSWRFYGCLASNILRYRTRDGSSPTGRLPRQAARYMVLALLDCYQIKLFDMQVLYDWLF